jgi:hypothetical protein
MHEVQVQEGPGRMRAWNDAATCHYFIFIVE